MRGKVNVSVYEQIIVDLDLDLDLAPLRNRNRAEKAGKPAPHTVPIGGETQRTKRDSSESTSNQRLVVKTWRCSESRRC